MTVSQWVERAREQRPTETHYTYREPQTFVGIYRNNYTSDKDLCRAIRLVSPSAIPPNVWRRGNGSPWAYPFLFDHKQEATR